MIRHVWFDVSGTLYRETPQFSCARDTCAYESFGQITGEQDLERIKQECDRLYRKYGSYSAMFQALGESSEYWQRTWGAFDANKLLYVDEEITDTLRQIKERMPIS